MWFAVNRFALGYPSAGVRSLISEAIPRQCMTLYPPDSVECKCFSAGVLVAKALRLRHGHRPGSGGVPCSHLRGLPTNHFTDRIGGLSLEDCVVRSECRGWMSLGLSPTARYPGTWVATAVGGGLGDEPGVTWISETKRLCPATGMYLIRTLATPTRERPRWAFHPVVLTWCAPSAGLSSHR